MGNFPCFAKKNKGMGSRNEEKKDQNSALNAKTSDKSFAKMNVKLEPKLDLSVPKDDDDHKSDALIFSYRELATATNYFSKESFIGEGGFGAVYKGKLEKTGQIVAVKQLNHNGLQGDKEFLVEVLMLSLLRHPNLVNMIGYCAEGEQRLLVYEFMHWGSLEDHLHGLKHNVQPLSWNTRMKIAADAANGINFLHNEANPQVIYRDLKSSNILLDEGFRAKISDFGLAKFGPEDDKSHVSTRVMGTHGYCAPEYACSGQLTIKSDVYSFGVVLLELITGRRALDSRGNLLVAWARHVWGDPKNFVSLADPKLKGQFSKSILHKAMIVAISCLREDPQLRPGMNDVQQALHFLASQSSVPKRNLAGGGTAGGETSQLNRNQDRERAVAEAKKWGETSRMKGQEQRQKNTVELNP